MEFWCMIIVMFLLIPGVLFAIGTLLWFARFNILHKLTYFLRSLRYSTKYLLACEYNVGSFLDEKLRNNVKCYLYAKEDGLHITTMDRLIPVKRLIPYEAVTAIYIEEGCEYDDYDSYFDEEPIDKYYPKHNAIPATIIIIFKSETGKELRLRLEMSGIMAPHNTEDLNYYSLLKHNIFEYILPKMPNCTMYKYGYGKKIRSAKPYPKQQ